jgi:flagellar motor switch protein FliN/FliY
MPDPVPNSTPTNPAPFTPDAAANASAATAGNAAAPAPASPDAHDPEASDDAAIAGGTIADESAMPPGLNLAELVDVPAAGSGGGDAPAAGPGIEELLRQANFEDPNGTPAVQTQDFQFPNFQQVMRDAQVSSIDLLRDVELNVKIELGRSRMLVEDVLKLAEGSVVELDKLAGDPVDVFVNERLVARGEVLVLNDNFCVRVNEIVAVIKDDNQ